MDHRDSPFLSDGLAFCLRRRQQALAAITAKADDIRSPCVPPSIPLVCDRGHLVFAIFVKLILLRQLIAFAAHAGIQFDGLTLNDFIVNFYEHANF